MTIFTVVVAIIICPTPLEMPRAQAKKRSLNNPFTALQILDPVDQLGDHRALWRRDVRFAVGAPNL